MTATGHASTGRLALRVLPRVVLLVAICGAASLTSTAPSWGAMTSSVMDGVLTIAGDEEDDGLSVSCTSTGRVRVNSLPPDTGPASCADITAMVITTGDGADYIDISFVRPSSFPALSSVDVDAGPGDDVVHGSRTSDAIAGAGGSDFIFADPAMNDVVDGGEGSDELFTSVDSDVTITPDALTTATGTFPFTAFEALSVGGGRDPQTMDGRAFSGHLSIGGRAGDDRIFGGSGTNDLGGGRGDDHVEGGPHHDEIDGTGGTDLLLGKGGDDEFFDESPHEDRLRGGAGDDVFCCVDGTGGGLSFNAGLGTDSVEAYVDTGGTAKVSDSRLTVNGQTGRVRSVETAFVSGVAGAVALNGVVIDASRFSGSSTLSGSHLGDVLIGGPGGDRLFGLRGDDELRGGSGPDALDGGPAADVCDGGPGADRTTHCE